MLGSRHFFILSDGCNGHISRERICELSANRCLIALDGACRFLRQLEIIPDIILGDMDSADPDILEYFKGRGSEIVVTPDQNFSDLEKGIMYCHAHGGQSITVFNACFGRMDHFIGNIFFLKKYHKPGCPIKMFTDSFCILLLSDESIVLNASLGAKCGLFGLPYCVVSVDGVKYPLNEKPLILGMVESVANEFISEKICCDVRGNCLVMYEI